MLLSDYAKGVLTQRVIRETIDTARKMGKRTIVDPKNLNFAVYHGASILTPNRKEFTEATRSRARTPEEIGTAARDAIAAAGCEAMLVTQSENGMTLVAKNGDVLHVPAYPVRATPWRRHWRWRSPAVRRKRMRCARPRRRRLSRSASAAPRA